MGRKPKAMIEAIAANTSKLENSSHLKIEKLVLKMHKNPRLHVSNKISKDKSLIVRRSGRLQSIFCTSQNQETRPVVEQINLAESEREDEPHVEREDEQHAEGEDETGDEREDETGDKREDEQHAEGEDETGDEREDETGDEREVEGLNKEHTPEPIPNEKSLEDKVDELVETVEQLKYELTEIRPSTDLIYKSLYIESKKKIEVLTDENYQLSKKLEIALLKLEAYESVKQMFDKLVSDVTKANEAVGNLSYQAALAKLTSIGTPVAPDTATVVKKPSAQRKRYRKEKQHD